MPQLFHLKCNHCDYKTKLNYGGCMYVIKDDGERVDCPHPGEVRQIASTLDIPWDDVSAYFDYQYAKSQHKKHDSQLSEETISLLDKRVGSHSYFICLDCLADNYLDKEKDELKCAQCNSDNLVFVAALNHQPCPKCSQGNLSMVKKGWT